MSENAAREEPDALPHAKHPRWTAQLFGQEEAESAILAAARAGRLPHAWLVTGPRGIGKATLAWALARFLLAGAPPDVARPGAAADPGLFRQTATLAHPGLVLVRRPWDEKGERLRAEIPVESIRDLARFFRLSAAEGGPRVAIIDAAEEMNVAAANALLKLLEEPPAGGSFILVSHRPARLLPTIRSRCRVLRCAPLAADPLARALAGAGLPAPRDPASLAELAAGSVGAALRLEAEDGLALYGRIVDCLAAPGGVDRSGIIGLAEAVGGREARARLDLLLDLVILCLQRRARGAAGAPPAPVTAAEARLLAASGTGLGAAAIWAETASRVAARSEHARGVYLDPGQVILDTFLQIDAAAGRIASAAA